MKPEKTVSSRWMKAGWMLAALLLAGGLLGPAAAAPSRPDAAAGRQWIATWEAAPQLVEPANLPPAPGLAGATLRQVIHVSLGGPRLRLSLSNRFGDGPLTLEAVAVARPDGPGAIVPGSARPVTFGGAAAVTIAAGACVWSDPVGFDLAPLSDLVVTIRCGALPGAVTGHPGSRTTSYLTAGDAVAAADLAAAARTTHWYLLDGAEVASDQPAAAVVALGDSITDGRGSITDGNGRWPDYLARRLQAGTATRGIAVLNAGIGGNCVLRGGLGPTALERLDHDVLDQAGVRWLIVFEGINDIGTGPAAGADAAGPARKLITGLEQIIDRAHARGLRVYGATITPFKGADFYFTPDREAERQEVNRWIRTGGRYDAVIDFDAVVRDPQDPVRLRPEADSGDHLHLDDRGYRVLADSVDLGLFAPPP